MFLNFNLEKKTKKNVFTSFVDQRSLWTPADHIVVQVVQSVCCVCVRMIT